MRTVSGWPWTTDGRWVVVDGVGRIRYDPQDVELVKALTPTQIAYLEIRDCKRWIADR